MPRRRIAQSRAEPETRMTNTSSASLRDTQFGRSSRRMRLQTLVRLRWLAVAGQTATVAVVALVLQFPLPLLPAALLVSALAIVNLALAIRFPPTHRLEPGASLALLALDLLQMGGLLFLTGGLAIRLPRFSAFPSSYPLPRSRFATRLSCWVLQ